MFPWRRFSFFLACEMWLSCPLRSASCSMCACFAQCVSFVRCVFRVEYCTWFVLRGVCCASIGCVVFCAPRIAYYDCFVVCIALGVSFVLCVPRVVMIAVSRLLVALRALLFVLAVCSVWRVPCGVLYAVHCKLCVALCMACVFVSIVVRCLFCVVCVV